jgi:hypothetical protein
MHSLTIAAIGLGTGLMLGVAAASMLGTAFSRAPKREPAAMPDGDDGDDDDALLAANAKLALSLQECNRRLSDLGQTRITPPAAVQPTATASTRMREQGRREATGPDWDRYAKQGVVPYNIPCLRDTPFSPSQRQLDRLGLAPHDSGVLRDAYQKSNQRVMAQLKPLCSKVLGSETLADRVGASACMSAIVDGARKENPDKMREALARVAEVNAGKRPPPAPGPLLEPVEALMLAFTAESKAFEADLAATLGPEDAHRIAGSRMLCSERGMVRAKQEERD